MKVRKARIIAVRGGTSKPTLPSLENAKKQRTCRRIDFPRQLAFNIEYVEVAYRGWFLLLDFRGSNERKRDLAVRTFGDRGAEKERASNKREDIRWERSVARRLLYVERIRNSYRRDRGVRVVLRARLTRNRRAS